MSSAASVVVKYRMALAFVVLLAAAVAAGPVLAAAGGVVSVKAGVTTEGITHEEYQQWQAEMNRWLSTETPSAIYAAPVRVPLGRDEIGALERASRSETPMRIGLVKAFTPAIAVDGLGRGRAKADLAGALKPTPDGGLVWAMLVRSDEAGAVRLHIEGMNLPAGAGLYVYSPAGEAFGPYVGQGPDGSGEFWTTTLFGSEAILQVRVPATVDDAELKGLAFRVTEAGFITANFAAGLGARPESTIAPSAAFCSNPACIVDASCYSAANSIKDAYAKMEWVQGAFIYTCTTGALNDQNPNQSNYVLTANHCLSSNKTAKNVTFYWRFRTSACNGTCPSNSGWPYKTTGATVAASGRKGDFTLMQLSSNPPAGTTLLGFTNVAVANTNGVALHRVSNPNFGPQVYNEQTVNTSAGTCTGWPRGERIYSRTTLGGTDGGSSGSPVVNSSDQVVGQLSGACGTNVNDPCDNAANATVDGALAYYWATVQPFLAP